ncbi:HNH endonuclease family protein [Streptosporangium canum]|uniref:HNH endonuclease family protein n=1 Tax=Streptosporangium canum TaxID=324952 RepID=UPI003425802A
MSNATKAVKLSEDLAEAASHYAALDNPAHDSWGSQLGSAGQDNIALLADFDLSPNKPLMLAAFKHFSPEEIRNLLRTLVSWSVRGMILNTMNAGLVEKEYCRVAVEIRHGRISTMQSVRDALDKVIPSDSEFKSAFGIAQVKRNKTARYYLRALEQGHAGNPEPELVPNPDESQINLEHVLPRNAKPDEWPVFDDIDTWAYLLGNMVLLQKTKNSKIGNRSFTSKRQTLLESGFALTKEIGDLPEWTPEAITERQKRLAELAVKVWPR